MAGKCKGCWWIFWGMRPPHEPLTYGSPILSPGSAGDTALSYSLPFVGGLRMRENPHLIRLSLIIFHQPRYRARSIGDSHLLIAILQVAFNSLLADVERLRDSPVREPSGYQA